MPLEKIVLDSFSSKGRAQNQKRNLEVIGGLPDEEVFVDRKKNKRIGFIKEILTPSRERVVPRCAHVPFCGGCSFQHLSYPAQLQYKQQKIEKEFQPILMGSKTIISPILGCVDPWQYRNKMEFSFSENQKGDKFLGLILAGSRGKVLPLSECVLVSQWFIDALHATYSWWEKSSLHAYKHAMDHGHLRTITFREAKQGKGKMAILTVSGNPQFAIKKLDLNRFVETLLETTPEKESLSIFLQIHQIKKGRASQFFEMLLFGPDHISEKLEISLKGKMYPLWFKISPSSFFQPNTKQAQQLISLALEMLSPLEEKTLIDLYCGGAPFGLAAALFAKKVWGIEQNPYSVFDARWNQETNQIRNFSVDRAEVGEDLTENSHFLSNSSFPDIVVLDPPRMGLSAKALQYVQRLHPTQILYVSCNPRSQAQNIKELCIHGYSLVHMRGVDLFPHTPHVENLALLQKT